MHWEAAGDFVAQLYAEQQAWGADEAEGVPVRIESDY